MLIEERIAPQGRVLVADRDADCRAHFQTILPELGYQLVAGVATGRELIEQCRQLGTDLVIADCQLPDVGVAEVARAVCRTRQVLFIATAEQFDPQHLQASGADHIWAYLLSRSTAPTWKRPSRLPGVASNACRLCCRNLRT